MLWAPQRPFWPLLRILSRADTHSAYYLYIDSIWFNLHALGATSLEFYIWGPPTAFKVSASDAVFQDSWHLLVPIAHCTWMSMGFGRFYFQILKQSGLYRSGVNGSQTDLFQEGVVCFMHNLTLDLIKASKQEELKESCQPSNTAGKGPN